ncbi:hypothetical protein PEL8287_00547 [Roseovarius litorisediminis]|uniref:Uncharacterized protein n=1 Tax=Roseovarius litorisediminis TaxID=1312363 RepID=A0A1Y5RDF2_9RHOB|nr:hypothetical protein [Roseovarius litorisediminis]SLN13643.1 hypothetical protein PEL8287_00547 [Roseovarius litorisediminis]
MTNTQTQLERLHRQIEQETPEKRFRFQPKLHHLITTMNKKGEKIPARTKRLHEKLLEEAIEAQFDNMPV